MFDQYHNTLKREEVSPAIPTNAVTSSGFVSVPNKEGPPIFSKLKMNLNLPHDISHLTVSNKCLNLLMTNNAIFRLNLQKPNENDEVALDKFVGGLKITNIFLDPLGAHLIIATAPKTPGISAELFYLHRRSTKPKKIDKV